MHSFRYVDNELFCENLAVRTVAEKVGTPFYLYSHETLVNHFRAYDSAFASIPHVIAFAMKANANLAVLRLFAKQGAGADIVSGGELYRALEAGVNPRKIVFAGVGKTAPEIRYALEAGILLFDVESGEELRAIDRVAGAIGKRAPVALRVNPDVDPKTHPYISTGMKQHKFGIAIERALQEYQTARTLKNIDLIGVHQHIGSQLTEVGPFVDALKRVLGLVEQLQQSGIPIRFINIGGGLGITYDAESPPQPRDLASAVAPLMKDLNCTVIMEPGRSLVGNAGILVTQVLYRKEGDGKRFVIVDAAMNDLIRPSLYGAYHHIQPVVAKPNAPTAVVDVVGPICESSDFLAKDRTLPDANPGELLAVMSAGAYGFTMASNYNARPRVAEVMVHGDQFEVVRARESYADLVRGERIPEFLR
jgi:diaminopimelate decarboxylase